MECLICGSRQTRLLDTIAGLDGRAYCIYNCQECQVNFNSLPIDAKGLYDKAYSQDDFSDGYGKYFEILSGVKAAKNPLEYLVAKQPLYLPVRQFLIGKSRLDILEVGCGLGYLTHALSWSGHMARGIDISEKSISLARENFGDLYENATIESLADRSQKYDLIIATELLEHLERPADFLKQCRGLLKSGGSLIVTTPNKDYYGDKYLWNTELPPLHLSWIGASGLKHLAAKTDLDYSFFNYLRRGVAFWERTNLLTDYLVSRRITYRNFYPSQSNDSGSKGSWLRVIFVENMLVRLICNAVYTLLNLRRLDRYVIISMRLVRNR